MEKPTKSVQGVDEFLTRVISEAELLRYVVKKMEAEGPTHSDQEVQAIILGTRGIAVELIGLSRALEIALED
jgi:hypothetical protein